MAYECIRYEVSQRVATLTLNRPGSLNAMSRQMYVECERALEDAEADDEIRCVIITGAGEAFSAGADIKGWTRRTGEQDQAGEKTRRLVVPQFERGTIGDVIMAMTKPVLAAINGVAVGLGATMPLACDLRIASDSARIAFLFVKRALVPECGSTFLLPRLVGYGTAKELCLTGRFVSAQEAKEIGLVNAVYPAAELMPRAMELAQSIAAYSPTAIKFIKRGFNMSLDSNYRDILQFERWALNTCFQSEDYSEAVRAFVEKRGAVFRGR